MSENSPKSYKAASDQELLCSQVLIAIQCDIPQRIHNPTNLIYSVNMDLSPAPALARSSISSLLVISVRCFASQRKAAANRAGQITAIETRYP